MLNLLAWLFLAWRGAFGSPPKRKDEKNGVNGIHSNGKHYKTAMTKPKSLDITTTNGKMGVNISDAVPRQALDFEQILSKKEQWNSTPPSYDSLFSSGSDSFEGSQGLDNSLEHLVAAASWHAVNDGPIDSQYYKTQPINKPKRQLVSEDGICAIEKQTSLESSWQYNDDVFNPDAFSETNTRSYHKARRIDDDTVDAASAPIQYAEGNKKTPDFVGTERTTIIANPQSSTHQVVKSVSVNVTEPLATVFSGVDDSGCLSDSFQSPKQYTSSLHTTLHSPFGSQENLSPVSYELEVDDFGHRRLDSWDSLRVEDHPSTKIHSGLPKGMSSDKDAKMKITVRPKPIDFTGYQISPVQVVVSPTKTRSRNSSSTSSQSEFFSNTNERQYAKDRADSVCDSSFGHAEVEEDVSMALLCEQEDSPSALASQSPIELKNKLNQTKGNLIDEKTVTQNLSQPQSQNRSPKSSAVNEDNSVLTSKEKITRRQTFDSESHSQMESFYEQLNQGMEFGSPPAASYRDFDEIMRKRRLKVDVMDAAGSVFGAFGSRDAKRGTHKGEEELAKNQISRLERAVQENEVSIQSLV